MLNLPVTSIKGIGTARAAVLGSEAGIETIEDLLYYAPRRYLDRSSIKKIIDIFAEEEVTVEGSIVSVEAVNGRKKILRVNITDGTDILSGVFFAGFSFFEKIFTRGETVLFSGKVKVFKGKQIVHPDFDFIDENSYYKSINTGRIIPLYPSTETLKKSGFDSRGFRRAVKYALENFSKNIRDSIDENIISRNRLLPLQEAIAGIHFPHSLEHIEKCRQRLAFNEIFFLQYYISFSRRIILDENKNSHYNYSTSLMKNFISTLPFQLTDEQNRALFEISEDILSPVPMNRLLQGDVGTGKTILALSSALIPVSSGRQVALMVPTEILASQHYRTALEYLPEDIRCLLLTGSMTKKEKDLVYSQVLSGDADIVIGTHSLIQSGLKFKDLAYIIIDEQHRFGVEQRAKLRSKGENTDLLVMTATPIPRSLSMTLYADMDFSSIREKPFNRKPVETLAFPESRIRGIYNSMNRYIDQGRQIFYVLPLIEESEKADLKSAEDTYLLLKEKIFPDRNVSIIHGRMSQNDKDSIMKSFKDGETDILVSTTVIEVGIDIPNANVIIIHHAERFGLAQIHQLRGRVGRGEHKSFCILVYPDNTGNDALERIKILTENYDGFTISELDLQLRGSGQLIGTKQHGASDFEFTDLVRDMDVITVAKKEAEIAVKHYIDNKAGIASDLNQRIDELAGGIRSKRILSILS